MAIEPGTTGALYRCTRCDALTDAPFRHNVKSHGGRLSYSDFALRRGAIHTPQRERPPVDPDFDVPMFEADA